MEFGWRRWINTVLATAAVTSAFWVILGGWFYYTRLHGGVSAAAPGSDVAAGQRPQPSGLIIPVVGIHSTQLTDTFTQARAGGARVHDAIDIMAPEGTAVIAAAPGRIEKLFQSHDGGTTVYERSADGRAMLYYAHLQGYAPGLAEGAQVARGAPIGRVGHTGNANPDAPHLHFAITLIAPGAGWSDDGTVINPYPLLGGK